MALDPVPTPMICHDVKAETILHQTISRLSIPDGLDLRIQQNPPTYEFWVLSEFRHAATRYDVDNHRMSPSKSNLSIQVPTFHVFRVTIILPPPPEIPIA
jgi:hypothetical protein